MKRIVIMIFVILICGAAVNAQDELMPLLRTLNIEKMITAYPAEKSESTMTIVNLDTDKELTVEVLGSLPPPFESGVIVKLSDDAWRQLGLPEGVARGTPHNRNPAPESEPPPSGSEPAALAATLAESESGRKVVLVYPPALPEEAPPARPPVAAASAAPPQAPPAVSGIQVLPGYPNPNSGLMHRLQVGAFAVHETSEQVARSMLDAGFDVSRELYRDPRDSRLLYRVIIVGIPAAQVRATVQKLEQLGIKQVWVRE